MVFEFAATGAAIARRNVNVQLLIETERGVATHRHPSNFGGFLPRSEVPWLVIRVPPLLDAHWANPAVLEIFIVDALEVKGQLLPALWVTDAVADRALH